MGFAAVVAMIFSTPLAALAAAGGAAAVPVIIHLLNRKRYVVIEWAAMRFLLAARKKKLRRLKLEQWLILATRILIALLIVAAMIAVMPWSEGLWQRIVPGEAVATHTGGRTHRILVIESSFTMSTRRGDELTRFETAKAQARKTIENASAGDGFSLIVLSAPAQSIVVGPSDDREKVLREIDDLVLPHGSADIPGGLNLVAELTNRPLGKYTRREVAIFTDLRRTAWPLPKPTSDGVAVPNTASDTWAKILSGSRVAFVDVAGEEIDNIAVSSVAIADPMPLIQTDLPVNVVVTNHGRSPKEKVVVELSVGKAGDRFAMKPLGQQLVDLPAFTSVNVVFLLEKQNRFREPGQYVLRVRAGDDALKLDDSRSLAVTVRDTIPVIVVNGKPSAEPLERASGFLTRALNPFAENELSAESPARVKVLTPREFQDAGLGDLFKPDAPTEVVFLCDMPAIGSNEAARLESHLKRGGSVVLALGPNAAANLDGYNRVLFNEGKGILPGALLGVKRADPGQHFSLLAADDAFKQPPLSAFQSEQERGSFATPRFARYVKIDLPPNSAARRLFSFLPSKRDPNGDRLDPAILEWSRNRGKVVAILSSVNVDWNEWPRTLSFAPFVQEVLRSLVKPGGRQTVFAGDPLEEYVPSSFVGLTAKPTRWDIEGEISLDPVAVVAQDEAGLIRIPRADRAGLYHFAVGKSNSVFAVNVPQVTLIGNAESDLRRISGGDLQAAFPSGEVVLVTDVADVPKAKAGNPGTADEVERAPRGPDIARAFVILLFLLLLVETYLAWQFGSARAGESADPRGVKPSRWLMPLWLLPMVAIALAIIVAAHGLWTGNFLGFLPSNLRQPLERGLGVPEAAPGEGTRWRLESTSPFTGDRATDQWLAAGLLLAAGTFANVIYRREKPGGGAKTGFFRHPTTRLFALRLAILAGTLGVLLPQLRLAFEREGWPDVVLVIDTSRSMGVVDVYRDPATKAEAAKLQAVWEEFIAPKRDALKKRIELLKSESPDSPAEVAKLERRLRDWQTPHRLNLVKAILLDGDGEWLKTILGRRQVRLHLYLMAGSVEKIVSLDDVEQRAKFLEDLLEVIPDGESSELGNGMQTILKAFRGESLNAAIGFTDGITTFGDDLPAAARVAARAGVPFYLIGIGDAAEPPDLSVGDLRAEETISVNDRLVVEVKVRSQGNVMPDSVPVTMSEEINGRPVEIAREVVRLDATGNPVRVKFLHQPKTPGEKKYIISVPVIPGETDPANNRLEHRVFVSEAKTLRVLMIEGYPRFDYRYLKSLFERESDKGQRSVELDVFLTTAAPEAPKQDRSAIPRVPTFDELKKYDVVVLGDFDPKQVVKGDALIESLTKYVKDHGGGLLILAGEQASPHVFRDTPLADIMPVICDGPPAAKSEAIPDGYRPLLTAAGQSHPLFRFSSEEAENIRIFNQLMPLYWSAKGYRRKLSAEVLAVHPDKPAETATGGAGTKDENHPLVLQQFVGAGRVLFIGFDETWRWRLRENEVHFNQFWLQAVRTLARGRVGRVEMRTDRKTYRRDDSIKVSVRFPDEAPPPEGVVRVRIDRRPKSGGDIESRTVQLAVKEGTRSTYDVTLPQAVEGDHTFTLVDPAIPARPSCEAKVLPPPGELDRVTMNETDLRRAAQESRGAYYTLADAAKLLDDLPNGRRVALDQPCPPLSLWNHWAAFVLMIWLLAAEWVIRKKWRLL